MRGRSKPVIEAEGVLPDARSDVECDRQCSNSQVVLSSSIHEACKDTLDFIYREESRVRILLSPFGHPSTYAIVPSKDMSCI